MSIIVSVSVSASACASAGVRLSATGNQEGIGSQTSNLEVLNATIPRYLDTLGLWLQKLRCSSNPSRYRILLVVFKQILLLVPSLIVLP
jgi:hypothetical protein